MVYVLGGWQSDFSANWSRQGRDMADAFAEEYVPADFWFDGELVPDVGVRIQPRIDRSVVLPLPEGPISRVSSPGTSVRFAPLTARTIPAPVPSSLTISMASRTGS